jgi:small GTP-binding protein
MIGDASVGKTSLFNRLIDHRFNDTEASTVGASWHSYVTPVDGREATFEIWDTAGEEKFRSLTPIYFRTAQGGVVVYDVTNRKSFDALEGWVDAFINHAGTDAAVVIVGNKCDADGRVVSVAEAQRWVNLRQFPLFHTSAKTGDGVEEPFRCVAQAVARLRVPAPVTVYAPKEEKCNC